MHDTAERQRLDKWLWFARIVRTRPLAQDLALSGHVRVNGQRVTQAARLVKPGDVLTIALAARPRVLKVIGLAERRGSASDASPLYEELG